MAENTTQNVDFFDIRTVEEGLVALREIEKHIIAVNRGILMAFGRLQDSLKKRFATRLQSEVKSLLEAFEVDSLQDFSQAAAIFGQELAGSLYQASLGFENLKAVIVQAAAPIAQALLPAVHTAIAFLTELALVARSVISFLFLGADQTREYAAGVKSAASSTKALKKSLAGFDQINRLNEKSGGGGIAGIAAQSENLKNISAKIKEMFKPLQDLDLSAAAESLERLKKAAEPLARELFAGLEWAWYNLFVPLAKWTASQLLPVFLDTLTAILQALSRVIQALKPDFIWLWEECLQPLVQWKGGQIIANLQGIIAELNRTSDWLGTNQGPVDKFIDSVRNIIQAAGELAQQTLKLAEDSQQSASGMDVLKNSLVEMFNPFREASGYFQLITSAVQALGIAFNDVKTSAGNAWVTMENLGNNGWSNLKNNLIDPAYSGVRQTMNRVVDLVNGMLSASATGINYIGKALNSISYTIPSWVPGIGGKGFSFSVKTVTAPQIPYLAKGAVLPANRPFMAVVGDQKHGTNIEAPLTVIQEAVASVMEDYSAANMAGHQATVGVLQELLSAVLGISIGDDMLAAAAARYDRKMAVVRGG